MLFLETRGGQDLLNFVETRARFDPGAGGFDHFGLRFSRAKWRKVRARVKEARVRIRSRRGTSAVYIEDPHGSPVGLYCGRPPPSHVHAPEEPPAVGP